MMLVWAMQIYNIRHWQEETIRTKKEQTRQVGHIDVTHHTDTIIIIIITIIIIRIIIENKMKLNKMNNIHNKTIMMMTIITRN